MFESGARLGPYEILAKLGEGGMGEVWRARDTRLGREVALKFLPEDLASDQERHARFEREAKLLASLNHPNIAILHALEHLDGQHVLVMELVEGDGLEERIAHGPVPADEALPIVLQIAEALEAAHEKGIVHRDLKPANVKVRPDGTVKVLDFGLAKEWEEPAGGSDLGSAPTITTPPTHAGVVLGTPAYMSPEQARGKPVDKRTDIWAFGCVLYEMLTGLPAFSGDTTSDVIAAIVVKEPDWSALPAGLAGETRSLLRRCMAKEQRARLHDVADARLVLSDLVSPRVDEPGQEPLRPALSTRRGGSWLALALAALGGAALATLLASTVLTKGAVTWRGERLVGGSVLAYGPRVSPDGSLVALMVVGEGRQSQVAVMRPGENHWTVVTHDLTAGPVLSLSWSHDGRLIYYYRPITNATYSVPALGGEERMVVEEAAYPEALADGSLVVERIEAGSRIQLVHVWPDQGREQALGPPFVEPSNGGMRTGPRAFADGREVVYFGLPADNHGGLDRGLYAIDVATGATRRLAPGFEFPSAEGGALLPAVAVDPLRDEVLVVVPRGDLHVVLAIPRSGRASPKPLLDLTASAWALDVGPDGSLFVDQVDVLGSVLRFSATGGVPRRIARFPGSPGRNCGVLELPDGGVLFTGVQSGRSVLMVGRRGESTTRFVETDQETSGPATVVGGSQVAFLIGPESRREIAIATLQGRVLRRIATPSGGPLTAFADLGDGRSLLVGDGGRLFAVDTTTGTSRELTRAEAGAVDPTRGDLLVLDATSGGGRIERIGLDGTPKGDLGVHPEIFVESWVGPTVDRSGRMLLTVGESKSWFLRTGLLNPADRRIQPIPLDLYGDIFTPSWARDGSILAIGWEYSANVWRFAESAMGRRGASGL